MRSETSLASAAASASAAGGENCRHIGNRDARSLSSPSDRERERETVILATEAPLLLLLLPPAKMTQL